MKGEKPPMIFEEYENRETFVEKYKRRVKENPFLTVGLLGLTGMLIAGTRRYRRLRADGMTPSIFLINLRVAAQGMFASALALGLITQYAKDHMSETNDKTKEL